jgi:hypothetical protein
MKIANRFHAVLLPFPIMSLRTLFTDHPAAVGESYGEHLVMASGFGLRMIFAGFACLIHAVLPFLFVRTGSIAINELHTRMVTNRHVKAVPEQAAPALRQAS